MPTGASSTKGSSPAGRTTRSERVGDNARGLDADTGFFGNFFFPVRSGEAMVEMMYQAQMAPWWMVQPEVQ